MNCLIIFEDPGVGAAGQGYLCCNLLFSLTTIMNGPAIRDSGVLPDISVSLLLTEAFLQRPALFLPFLAPELLVNDSFGLLEEQTIVAELTVNQVTKEFDVGNLHPVSIWPRFGHHLEESVACFGYKSCKVNLGDFHSASSFSE